MHQGSIYELPWLHTKIDFIWRIGSWQTSILAVFHWLGSEANFSFVKCDTLTRKIFFTLNCTEENRIQKKGGRSEFLVNSEFLWMACYVKCICFVFNKYNKIFNLMKVTSYISYGALPRKTSWLVVGCRPLCSAHFGKRHQTTRDFFKKCVKLYGGRGMFFGLKLFRCHCTLHWKNVFVLL